MRQIGELDTPRQAEVFLSYLLVNGIEGHFEEGNGVVEIWIKDEDFFQDATAQLKQFRSNPTDSKYVQSVDQAASLLKEKQKRQQEIKKRIVPVSGGRAVGPTPYLTISLIAISVLVAIGTNFGNDSPLQNPILKAMLFTHVGPLTAEQLQWWVGTNPDSFDARTFSIQRGEIWRMVTPIFIHFGVTHILFNMWWLASLGNAIEKRYGWLYLGALVLAAAIIPNLAQCLVPVDWGGSAPYLWPGPYLITLVGGMSGVVYGLFGFVWMKSVYDRRSRLYMSELNIGIMIAWLVACCFADQLHAINITFIPQNVANWAHGVGLLVGVVVGYFSSLR